jgi:hypothetical protein
MFAVRYTTASAAMLAEDRQREAADALARERALHDAAHAIYAAAEVMRTALHTALDEVMASNDGAGWADKAADDVQTQLVDRLLRNENPTVKAWVEDSLVKTWGLR